MGSDPDAADNRRLREAWKQSVPLIYFLGVSPGRYQAIVPAFIANCDRQAFRASVGFGAPDAGALASEAFERRCALRIVKQRLHQTHFKDAAITAY